MPEVLIFSIIYNFPFRRLINLRELLQLGLDPLVKLVRPLSKDKGFERVRGMGYIYVWILYIYTLLHNA